MAALDRAGGTGTAARLLTVLGRVVRLAVATFVVAAAGVAVPGVAQAATCSSASGVSVVVDYHQLGGGVSTFCDAGGAGKTAAAQLVDAGFSLDYVQQQPGFVCRVDGKPASDPCVRTPPSNAYWSLWWSDGKSGKWAYASSGATALKVPDGGYVGLSWQQGSGKALPGAAATSHSGTPSSAPTSKPPSSGPTHGPTHAPTSQGPGSPTSSAGAPDGPTSGSTGEPEHGKHSSQGQTKGTGKAGRHHHQKNDSTARASDDASSSDQADGSLSGVDGGGSSGSGGSGLPGWVGPVVIVVLFAGAGGFALVRRKSRGGA